MRIVTVSAPIFIVTNWAIKAESSAADQDSLTPDPDPDPDPKF
jgi:hypothetical protein